MVIVHNKRRRKPTGGRYKDVIPKRLSQKGYLPTLTKLGVTSVKLKITRGGGKKRALMTTQTVNVMDAKKNKAYKAKINSVVENTASRHFVRRNIITKGAVIETDKGKAKVTNRPGQEGVINAVLIE